MEYVNTKEKLANIFTKALPREPCEYLGSQLEVLPLSKATERDKESPTSANKQYIFFIDKEDITLGIS